MKKINFFFLNRIALIFPILFVFLFLYSATVNAYTDTSKDYEVSVSRAEIQSEYGIVGENSILFDKNTIFPKLGDFKFPGAYAQIYIEVKNAGNSPVTLADLYVEQPSLDYIELIMPEFEKNEILMPNDSSGFSIIVRWRNDSSYNTENKENGNISFKLLYTSENDKDVINNTSVKTGFEKFEILCLAAVILISFVIYIASSIYKNKLR